jgi:hypothetical protein
MLRIYLRTDPDHGIITRDAPDTVFAGYRIRLIQKTDTGYPVRAGYRISGRILGSTTTGIFFVKYQINLKNSFNNYRLLQRLKKA